MQDITQMGALSKKASYLIGSMKTAQKNEALPLHGANA